MLMAEINHDYRFLTFLLWGAVIALASLTIANYYGVTGRQLLLPPVVAVGIYFLLVNQHYGKFNQHKQTSFPASMDLLNISNTSSDEPNKQSRQSLTDSQKRQWLNDFLARQQEK